MKKLVRRKTKQATNQPTNQQPHHSYVIFQLSRLHCSFLFTDVFFQKRLRLQSFKRLVLKVFYVKKLTTLNQLMGIFK